MKKPYIFDNHYLFRYLINYFVTKAFDAGSSFYRMIRIICSYTVSTALISKTFTIVLFDNIMTTRWFDNKKINSHFFRKLYIIIFLLLNNLLSSIVLLVVEFFKIKFTN